MSNAYGLFWRLRRREPSALLERIFWQVRIAASVANREELSMRAHRRVQPISAAQIVIFSAGASSLVFATALLLQWMIYDDWLHRTGPVRLVGTSVATLLTFAFVCKWMMAERARHADMLRRFEIVARMNDRIRNAVQAIACTDFAFHPESAEDVREAVCVIDDALRGVVDTVSIPKPPDPVPVHRNAAAKKTSA